LQFGFPHRFLARARLYSSATVAGLMIYALCWLLPAACSRQASDSRTGPSSPPAPVTVAVAVSKSMPLQLEALGAVESISSVEVKAQVSGMLTSVHFQPGQTVKKGDLLFSIDPRPYEYAVRQAEGALARDRAQLDAAQKARERLDTLLERKAVSQEEYEAGRAAADALAAQVRTDRATLQSARLLLQFCSVTAPADGTVGRRLVDPGNLVKPNDPTLVVINQVSPIYVNLSAPQDRLAEVRRFQAAGRLSLQALIPGEEDRPETGELTLVDNAVDQATGTVLLQGTFPNPEQRLWPGQYVKVILNLATQENQVVAPAMAVQTGQQGQYVLVVKPDQTAEVRPVVSTRVVGGEAVVDRGLEAGTWVVTDGQLRVVPGGKVAVKNAPPAEPPAR